MAEVNRFELAPIPDRRWGIATRSWVRFDGRPTNLIVEGSTLLAQHEAFSGFLLWVSFEGLDGVLRIYLVSPGVTVLDVRELGGELVSGELRDIAEKGGDVYEFSFLVGDRWRLTVLPEPRREFFRRTHVSPGVATRGANRNVLAYRYLELAAAASRPGSAWGGVLCCGRGHI